MKNTNTSNGQGLMKSYELVGLIKKQVGCKRLAGDMHVSPNLVNKWARPRTDGRSAELNPLDRADALQQCAHSSRVAMWICQRAGGIYVANPPAGELPANATLLRAQGRVQAELARWLALMAEASAAGRLPPAQTRALREQWDRLKSIGEGFVRAGEMGRFRELPTP